jgi:hypothetical protein
MSRLARAWLLHCADPLGPRVSPPAHLPSPRTAHEMVRQAELHGVLPALLRHFPFDQDPALAPVKADTRARHRTGLGFSLLLRAQAEALMAELAGLPVTVMKGPAFARHLYPDPQLRGFTDVDLLAAPQALPQLAVVLEARGYGLGEVDDPDRPQEWKWLHRENTALMVEVQTNLIHRADLCPILSVTYDDIAAAPTAPAALLLTALIHGGAGHRYKRLQHIVDILQGARALAGAAEEARFEALVVRTGARFVAVVGLELAGRLFHEPRCHQIARALGPVRYTRLARVLLGRTVAASTMARSGWFHSLRRLPLRPLIKLSRRTLFGGIRTADARAPR